jgi:hypothetical protein
MLLLLALAAASGPAGDAAAIRAMRARSNQAIAAHDYAGVAAMLAPGYSVIPGSLGKPLDAEKAAERIGAGMKDPTFVTYLRTPRSVTVAANRKRAAESGSWLGLWRKPDGEMRLTGSYLATWVPTEAGWKLLNESFVSLRCTGSRECDKVY